MRKIGILLLQVTLLLTISMGCQKHSKDGNGAKVIQNTRVQFSGYENGCAAVYEPFYCSDKYKPNGTQADTVIGTGYLKIGKKLYILPPEVASDVIKSKGVKEWHKEN